MTTYLIYSDIYLEHDTGPHPETAMRLSATMAYLKRKGWDKKTSLVQPRSASVDEIAYIHNREYIESVKEVAEGGGGYLDGDTPLSERSYEAALYAAGGVMSAVDKVIAEPKSNALCLVRPPGHHARPDCGMGFCLFNNVAIATRYVQKRHHIARVAIIDWDLHHGNGTQEAFYKDDTVLFCSLHRYPYYPGSGSEMENGEGQGKGFTVNIPLPEDVSSKEYLESFSRLMSDSVKPFKPEFIFISAGFDSYRNDPLGGLGLDIEDYAQLTRKVRAVADECCQGRLVSTLEGGYDLQGLPLCIEAHLSELCKA